MGMAKENRSWAYDRIIGALANLGYRVSHQTVGNVLRRQGIASVPEPSGRQPGQNWELTSRCWQARTSSRWRSSRGEAW